MTVHEEDDRGLARRVYASRRPLVVDVWAEWCPPCKALSPVLETLSDEHEELEFIKVDADANDKVLDEYGVRGLPTILLIQNGEVVARRTGAAPKQVLEGWLAEELR